MSDTCENSGVRWGQPRKRIESWLHESGIRFQVATDSLRNDFNILFGDNQKRPTRPWQLWQTEPQTGADVKNLFDLERVECYGYVCGFHGLEVIDFDHAWIYRLWQNQFKERANTRTVATPHHGRHAYFLTDPPKTDDSFKESLGVELKGPGRFVVAVGKIKRVDGYMGEYVPIDDGMPVTDNKIVADTLGFLTEIKSKYHFLQWKCLHPIYSEKIMAPSHEARLIAVTQMIHDGFAEAEIHNFFEDCTDYQERMTQTQIDSTRRKEGLKPWRCETIREKLGIDEDTCKGCRRHRRKEISLDDPNLHEKLVALHIEKIKAKIMGEDVPPVPYDSDKETYDEIVTYFKTYVRLDDLQNYLAASYVRITHQIPNLSFIFLIFITGLKGSGKSTLGEITSRIAYHACWVPSATFAFLTRVNELVGGATQIFDEYDKMEDDRKIEAYIRGSTDRSQGYGVVEPIKIGNVTYQMPDLKMSFGARVLISALPLKDPMTRDRCIEIVMQMHGGALSEPEPEELRRIKGHLAYYRQTVKIQLTNEEKIAWYKPEYGTPRLNETRALLLKVTPKEYHTKIDAIIKEEFQQRTELERHSYIAKVIEALTRAVLNKATIESAKGIAYVACAAIKEEYDSANYDPETNYGKTSLRSIGHALKELRLNTERIRLKDSSLSAIAAWPLNLKVLVQKRRSMYLDELDELLTPEERAQRTLEAAVPIVPIVPKNTPIPPYEIEEKKKTPVYSTTSVQSVQTVQKPDLAAPIIDDTTLSSNGADGADSIRQSLYLDEAANLGTNGTDGMAPGAPPRVDNHTLDEEEESEHTLYAVPTVPTVPKLESDDGGQPLDTPLTPNWASKTTSYAWQRDHPKEAPT